MNVDGRTARVLVKANHAGEGISVESAYDNPNKNLNAYTVMLKRENGYDDEKKLVLGKSITPKVNSIRTQKVPRSRGAS